MADRSLVDTRRILAGPLTRLSGVRDLDDVLFYVEHLHEGAAIRGRHR
jgi:hypothetical protein